MVKFMKNKIKSFIINSNRNPVFIVIHWLFTLIALIVTITNATLGISKYNKDLSGIIVNCISSTVSSSNDMEIIRFGVHNYSEDAKEITKAKIHILNYRDDNTNIFVSECKAVQEGVSIIIYNSGWCDLSDVKFSVSKDSDFYNNLKDKTKFNQTFSTLKHGEEYELGILTTDDLLNITKESPIIINCNVLQDNNKYETSCSYEYNQYLDKLTISGKGGGTEKYDIEYCVDTSLGVNSYEIPVEYSCPPNGYEEINFSLSANRSCHIRYSIEFYAQDNMIFKTDEKTTNFKINSRFVGQSE